MSNFRSNLGRGLFLVASRFVHGVRGLDNVSFGPDKLPGLVTGTKGQPGVIVIQEWWGITENVKRQATRLSEQGFRVLVPDIYKGEIGVDKEEASHLMENLDFPKAVKEIGEAAAYLKEEGSAKVGVVGFCMGGALTMGSLAASKDLTCGAPFYGVNFGLFEASQLRNKPVQAHFGAQDQMMGFSDPETGKKLLADLQAAGNDKAELFIYDGVGHAFMNDEPGPYDSFQARQAAMGIPPYNSEQAELAWSRLVPFFQTNLGPGKKEEL